MIFVSIQMKVHGSLRVGALPQTAPARSASACAAWGAEVDARFLWPLGHWHYRLWSLGRWWRESRFDQPSLRMIPRKRIGKRALRALGTDPYLDQFISPLYCFLKILVQIGIKAMARKGKLVKAVAYMRTSSATNVGADKDSDKRQRAAVAAFAKRAGFEIVGEFYDPAVKGEDRIETRPGFAALLDRIEGNGVRVVIIDEISRFARDVLTQELGILALIKRGVTVLTASGDDLTNTDDPMKVFTRQIAGAFAQLEKARLVAKLRVARERKRAEGGKVEGRKTLGVVHHPA